MKKLFLRRDIFNEYGTLGILEVDGETFYSLENPWIGNERNISCIPEGEYVCEIKDSPRWGNRYHLLDTEPRTHILIHWGNYPKNTQGCILLGLGRREDYGNPAVWNSKKAVEKFESLLAGEPFELSITSEDGVPG